MNRLLEILALLWRIDRRNITIVAFLTPINALTTVAAAFALKLIVDAVEAGDMRLGLWAAILAAFTLGAAPALAHVQHVLQRLVSDKLAVDIDRQTLELIADLPSVTYAENPTHLDRIELVLDQGRDLVASLWAFSGLLVTIVRLVLSAFLLGLIHPVLAALPLFALPVIWFAWVGRRHVKHAEQAAAEDQRISKSLGDMFLNHATMMEMKIFRATGKLSDLAGQAGQRVLNIRFWGSLRGGFLIALGWIVFGFGFAAAFAFAGQLYLDGQVTLGDFVLIWQLSVGSLFYISFVLDRLQELFRALEVFAHLDWLRDFQEKEKRQWATYDKQDLPAQLQSGLSLKDVSFSYPGAANSTLQNLTLDLKAGSVVAIVGGNGAGKSSLAKILLGLYRPDAAQIELDGVPLDQIDAATWQQATSATHQDYARIEGLLRQSIGLGDYALIDEDTALDQAIQSGAATDFTAPLPDGLDSKIGKAFQKGIEPSGGQWQRLATARSFLCRRPLLMVLDEPTNSIDPLRELDLLDQYRDAARELRAYGGILVIMSHRFTTVRDTDQIVVLEKGNVVESGSHEDLLSKNGVYGRLFTEQAQLFS